MTPRPAVALFFLLLLPLIPSFSPARAFAAEPSAAGTNGGALDRSGEARRGQAAVFAERLAGRRMADGGRFELASDAVASPTLPLGTTARVRNLRNNRATLVRVRDRLPASGNRILNVSPRVARLLGMGPVASVEVTPLAVPQPDGSIRLGQGTGLAGRRAYQTDPPVR